jgi:hypothetical protein
LVTEKDLVFLAVHRKVGSLPGRRCQDQWN